VVANTRFRPMVPNVGPMVTNVGVRPVVADARFRPMVPNVGPMVANVALRPVVANVRCPVVPFRMDMNSVLWPFRMHNDGMVPPPANGNNVHRSRFKK
jgi:hypothetical protein